MSSSQIDRVLIGPGSTFRGSIVSFLQQNFDGPVVVGVTGGRDFNDPFLLAIALGLVREYLGIAYLLHGNARGADRLAGVWAHNRYVSIRSMPARWKADGDAAGPLRNEDMAQRLILEKPSCLCVAMPGGNGTLDMMNRCRDYDIPLLDVMEFLD